MRGIPHEHLAPLCGAAGALALLAAAWLRRGASDAPGGDPSVNLGADGLLRAHFGASAAPAVAASGLSALVALGAWAIGGGPGLLVVALAAALVASVASPRTEWPAFAAAQVAAVAGASWLGATLATRGALAADAIEALPARAALLPIVLASFGALASAVAVFAARTPPRLEGEAEEGPALSRALLRPAAVASVLVLVCAAALGDVLDLRETSGSMRGAQVAVASGLVYGLLLFVAGAPWPLSPGRARGEALLQLGARVRTAPAQLLLGLAVATASFGAAGAWGVTLAAAALLSTAAMPLAAARFCRAHAAALPPLQPVSGVVGKSAEVAWGVAAAAALGVAAAEPLLRDAVLARAPIAGGVAGGALAALGLALAGRALGPRPALALGALLAAATGALAGRADLPGVFAGVAAGGLAVAGTVAAGPVGLRACLPLVVLAASALLAAAPPPVASRDAGPPGLVAPDDDADAAEPS